jgi:heme oxygenase
MNVVAVITWFSAVAGGLLLLAARLVRYTGDLQGGAVTRVCVSDLRRARGGSAWRGEMT